MFESDQHEFDDEYAEISHPAPPPPPKPAEATPTPAAPAAPVAVAAPIAPAASSVSVAEQEPIVDEPREEEQEEAAREEAEPEEYFDPAEKPLLEPPQKKKPNLVLIGGFAAIALFAIVVLITASRSKTNASPSGDLGPGIVAVAGLRGHLDTIWEGDSKTGRLAYKLRIEPMEDRWGAGFSRVASNPPMPISVNIRLLDASGFALCGKEIDFRFNPQTAAGQVAAPQVGADGKKLSLSERNAAQQAARQSEIAAEAIRERGKDVFQNQTTDEGQVTAVNVQGSLPCSPDQYRRVDYWDLNTNFPTLDEQAVLLDPRGHSKESEPSKHADKRALAKLQDGFVIQGDDRVTGYDSVHGTLWAESKSFSIDKRYGQTTASAWANNYTLIHYRCDQQANCALTAAGDAAVLHARLSE